MTILPEGWSVELKESEALSLLRQIQWLASPGDSLNARCPVCYGMDPNDWDELPVDDQGGAVRGHTPTCRLAALLRENG